MAKKIQTLQDALEHFKWKFENTTPPTESDLKAYNVILDYKEMQETINLSQNENLAKLWIHQLMLLSNTSLYSGERAIQVIDEILSESVYDWTMKLKEQIPMMRFNHIALSKYPLGDVYNKTQQLERNNAIIEEFETELTEALKYEISEENIIKFVKGEITRIINKFEK